MTLAMRRNLLLFVPCAAVLASRALESRLPVPRGGPSAAAALLGIALLGAAGSRAWLAGKSSLSGAGLREYPAQAVEFLDRHRVEGRMFNEYDWGGYLIWKAAPRRKVFVDGGRTTEYGAEHVAAAFDWRRPEVWERLDRKWAFDHALVINGGTYRARVLDDSPAWALVYWDDAALVYLKRRPGREPLIRRHEYRRLRPNRADYHYLPPLLRDPRARTEVLAELDRAVGGSRQNVNALQMRSLVRDALGRPDEARSDLEAALARAGHKPGPWLALGWHHERSGRWPEAAEAYRRALRLAKVWRDPKACAAAANNIGVMEFRLGRLEEADRRFSEALRLDPTHRDAAENLRRLRLRAGRR